MRRAILLLAVYSALSSAALAADRTTLYGMTYDGYLLKIDRLTGAGTVIRGQLAPQYRSIDSLEFVDNKFYASYDGGRIVKFGFNSGDEVVVGDSGLPYVEALAADSTDRLFASVSRDNDVSAEGVGQVNLTNGSVSSIVDSADMSVAWDMDAMAFDTFDRLFGINLDNPRKLFQFNKLTGAITNAVDLTNIYPAMTILPRFDTFYAASTDTVFLSSTPADLYILDQFTGNETLVGSIGYANVTGLTFGPVPEPASLLALGAGLVGLTAKRRKRA
ncbi:MAG: PEP-CTERM sorting domain-containing protein [Fimbriimonadia bacterium]|nr:PEP-CTERM sorting domain-containing protein [Fimbriimonadia bacterium]